VKEDRWRIPRAPLYARDMAGPADRDAAIRTLLSVQTATMEGVGERLEQQDKSIVEIGTKVDKNTAAIDRVEKAVAAWHAEQKLTLWRIALRALDQAAINDPLKVTIILATTLILFMFILLGGAYSLLWHENPATVIRELETLVPFFGASKP